MHILSCLLQDFAVRIVVDGFSQKRDLADLAKIMRIHPDGARPAPSVIPMHGAKDFDEYLSMLAKKEGGVNGTTPTLIGSSVDGGQVELYSIIFNREILLASVDYHMDQVTLYPSTSQLRTLFVNDMTRTLSGRPKVSAVAE